MIVDCLENAERYHVLHPAFAQAFDFLRQLNQGALAPGRHDLDGDRLYMMAASGTGGGRDNVVMEAHQKYIDIHFTLEGTEEIGWKPAARCSQRKSDYDPAADCELFTDQPDCWTALPPDTFAIYFPEDAHAPMVGEGPVRKAVVKVAVG